MAGVALMCGICGFTGVENRALLSAMTLRLEHRGPDEDGFFTDGNRVSLGMRRLKIIDLKTGSQPISNEDGAVTVVFNGEIYNFKELRAGLEAQGHRFRTNTDTEVLVHLYEQHGEGFARLLRGMFAFALWDASERKLLLARDHFGVKPLFYAQAGEKLFFASEIKALLLAEEVACDLDPAAVDAYFSRLYVPAPGTIYKGVKKLEPAQTLVFKDGAARIFAYWELPAAGQERGCPRKDCLEAIDGLLADSVREQLVSDVPLGLLLSGGMDSSSLLYYMSRSGKGPVKTFTVGYGGKDSGFSEASPARRLAERFGAEHHETIINPDPVDVMQKLAAQFDEPFADASAIPTYLVTREARKKVTVALTGVGGDEFFGGYPRHLGSRFLKAYLRLPAAMRNGLWAAVSLLPESEGSMNLPGRFKRFVGGGRGDFKEAFCSWISYLTPAERAALLTGPAASAAGSAGALFRGRLESPDDIFAYELSNYLPDDLLCLSDRASMANSLELRVPFLDVRLAEFMAGVPMKTKTGGFRLKRLLKKVMEGRLPDDIISAPKRGFQVPLARWYKEELRDFASDILSSGRLKADGFLSPAAVEKMISEHRSGRRNLNDQIHAAVMFELWLGVNKKRLSGTFRSGIRTGGESLTVLVGADIIQQDDAGGSGRLAWETSRRLAAMGHRVIVITKGGPGLVPEEVSEGVEIFRYGGGVAGFLASARNIKRRFGKIDALYLHHPYTAALALAAFRGVPAVYSFNSPWGEEYSIRCADKKTWGPLALGGAAARKLVERWVLKRSREVLSASSFMAGRLKEQHGLPSKIVPLGVDTVKFVPAADRAAVRSRLGIAEGRFVIFTVRNLAPRMGLENLVAAAAKIARQKPEALFLIGGDGYLKAKLEALISSAGLSSSVKLTGYIPEAELAAYYQAADLFVLPTRELEGFGLVTLEALACGTPVLATPVAANVEVLGGFKRDLLFKSETPDDIAAGIEDFMARPAGDAAGLRAECRTFVEANYSWNRYAAEVEKNFYGAGN